MNFFYKSILFSILNSYFYTKPSYFLLSIIFIFNYVYFLFCPNGLLMESNKIYSRYFFIICFNGLKVIIFIYIEFYNLFIVIFLKEIWSLDLFCWGIFSFRWSCMMVLNISSSYASTAFIWAFTFQIDLLMKTMTKCTQFAFISILSVSFFHSFLSPNSSAFHNLMTILTR